MAIYPKARVRLMPREFARATVRNRVNLHTAVTDAASLYPQFSMGGACSHFYVDEHGTVEQYIDTDFHSAADYEGNDATISVETWDGYGRLWRNGDPVPPWNLSQVTALDELAAWILRTHQSIPVRLATNSYYGETSKGLSWHRLGVDGNFPELPDQRAGRLQRGGGMHWSKAWGKSCPGDARIAQIPGILASVQLMLTEHPTAPDQVPDVQEDDDMRIIRNATSGAAFLLAGGVGAKIINGAELKLLQESGIETTNVGDGQYGVFAGVYLAGA